ncbi:MAG TPA: histidine--tRNA ligase [Candidatus Paceibacterota bacterium]
MTDKQRKLSTEAYKGVRDFYPEDMFIQKHIFDLWKKHVEAFGYVEYNASVLEPSELYKAKSGDEIVNEQTYSFKDRGDRDVTLRPEMTPTLARMVAGRKRELGFPLRWYSIPNLFRYEQPQRGRLREHWQLNVDIIGVESIQAEIEIIQIAYNLTKAFGLKDADFEIRINNRMIVNYVLKDVFALSDEQSHVLSKLIDRKEKMSAEEFKDKVATIFEATPDKAQKFLTLINSQNFEEYTGHLPQTKEEHESLCLIKEVIVGLEALGIRNVRFDQTLMRGFDYYTGTVFEVFDNNPKNRRAILGGGRYDEILGIFGEEKVPFIGFGAGDVVVRDLMETYGTLPTFKPAARLAICPTDLPFIPYANEIAQKIRQAGISVAVDYTQKKIGDKVKNADKNGIPYVICVGEEEQKSGKFKIKNLKTREEVSLNEENIIKSLR